MRTSGLSILGLGLAAVTTVGAAILQVSQQAGAPYATIQSAIDAAVPGADEVYVRCGRYLENIVMRSGVPVRGEDPECTFIDGRRLGPVVTMTGLVDTKLSQFTIENGEGNSGGGIRVVGGSPIIEGNRIRNNRVNESSSVWDRAGGIAVAASLPYAAPVITRNLITGNEGAMGTGGAFVYGYGRVEGNVFAKNRGNLGALNAYFFYGTISNNTIVRTERGAGISLVFSDATVGSNIVAYNPVGISVNQAATLASNDVFGNGVNYLGMPDQNGLNGNISVDPLFVSENEESFFAYEPRSNSPVLDLVWQGSPVELSGLTAPVDGRSAGAAIRDIGAKENEGVTNLRFTPTDIRWDLSTWPPIDYTAFRGDLETLRSTGVYCQDPSIVPGARHFCDFTFLSDGMLPPPGTGWFYLSEHWGSAHGTLGFDSARHERPYLPIPCTYPD